MKLTYVLFLALFFSPLSEAKILTQQDYSFMPQESKVEVIKAYREFLREMESKSEKATETTTYFNFDLIQKAFADNNYDCFYAGWPSRKIGGKCTNPQRANSSYQGQVSNSTCSGSQLLCNPVLFGTPGLCASTATQALRNNAYNQCETKFAQANRTVSSVAESLNQGDMPVLADELFDLADSICTRGFQSGSGMCNKLKAKIASIQSQRSSVAPTEVASAIETPTPTQVVAPESGRVIDSSQVTQVSSTEIPYLVAIGQTATQLNEVVAAVGVPEEDCPPEVTSGPIPYDPAAAASVFRKVICPAEPAERQLTPSELTAFLAENNIVLVPNNSIASTPDFQRFLTEFHKFPTPLLQELKSRGARIHLIVGEGVTADPSWAVDEARAVQVERTYNEYMSNRAIASGTTYTPINTSRLWRHTFDSRPWSAVPGAGGDVGTPGQTVPTRIVLNKLNHGHDHGSTNLFLHEHGHTLDSMYGPGQRLSNSPAWRNVLAKPKTQRILNELFSRYEQNTDEGFAELFAYYHSCGSAKQQLETEAPELAAFFQNLTNVRSTLNAR